MVRRAILGLASGLALVAGGCASAEPRAAAGDDAPSGGLLLALSQFQVSPEGKVLPKPGPALLEIVVQRGGSWQVERLEDPDSNVFHKAMVYDPGGGGPGILTLGGTRAVLKLWRRGPHGWAATPLWERDFGGKFSRMRDAEILPLPGGAAGLAVATHDQGVVALVEPRGAEWGVRQLDAQPNTFVHEIEIGDVDGNGSPEIYATPSSPNLFDGRPQPGAVVRFDLASGGTRTVVADLAERHAKEILVDDVDGDGRDELYVSVEAVEGGKLELRRYDAGTAPGAGRVIAELEDRLCRFLTAGDVDGDGRKEIVAAAHKSGLWLLRPPATAAAAWSKTSIDRASSGFEHAALLADLDADRIDELYVASDDQGELRRYRWRAGRFEKEVLLRRDVPESVFTWNLMPVPASLLE